MKVKIEIDTRTFVRFWLVVIGFVLVGMALYKAQTALLIIGAAFFLALALNPPVKILAKRLPGKSRVLGTALSYVIVLVILAAIIFLVIPPILEQTAKFVATIPAVVNGAIDQYSGVQEFIARYNLQDQVNAALDSIKASTTTLAGVAGVNLIASITSVFTFITSSILVLVLAFLLLIEGPTLMKKVWSAYVNKERMEYHRSVVNRMYEVVTGYVTGQLTVSAIAGVVAGLAVFVLSFIFDIPANFALPTAAIVGLLSLIPMFGAMIGAVLVGVILAFSSIPAAIIFVVFFILYQQLEANYIHPKIQSKRINLSALYILIAVTVGIYTFGLVGGILSIPIAGCVKIIFDEYIAHRAKRHKLEDVEESQFQKALKKS